jgi:hypothetical protein
LERTAAEIRRTAGGERDEARNRQNNEALESALDKLLATLLGDGVYPDRLASCNKARHAAEGSTDPMVAALRKRAQAAEHRVAGLCAANADCYRIIADLRARLGLADTTELAVAADSLDRNALRIVERERDEARAELAQARRRAAMSADQRKALLDGAWANRTADGTTESTPFTSGEATRREQDTIVWKTIDTAPEDELVETMTDHGRGDGVENVRVLRRSGQLWFLNNSSDCVFYTPTHWREKSST